MTRRKLFLSTGIAFVLTIVIATSFALGQGGIVGQSPSAKVTFMAKQTELVKEAAKFPTAPKGFIPDKLATLLTPRTSCPDATLKPMIYDYRPMGPWEERGIVNVAVVIKNDVAYSVLAGSPIEIGKQGINILKQFGMIIVRQQYLDPCAAKLAGKTSIPDKTYITESGNLRITQIDGDAVVLSIAGIDTDRFNFITGQFTNLKLVATPTSVPPATPTSRAYP